LTDRWQKRHRLRTLAIGLNWPPFDPDATICFSRFSREGDKMTIVLALAVLTASASAIEDAPRTVKPSGVSILCTKSGEHLAGLTKVCYYSCAGSEGALKEPAYEACPDWHHAGG
jgi:hypothetical protein